MKKGILWMLVLCTMLGIFFLSSQDGESSSGLSRQVTLFILKFSPSYQNLDVINQAIISDRANDIVRALAHIGVYFVLGITVTLLLLEYSLAYTKSFAAMWCILFSIVDELNQHFFSVARSFQLIDLYKDGIGSIIGIALTYYTMVYLYKAK